MEEIKREPIVGLRKSIVGLRVPIMLDEVVDKEMNWDTQYKKLTNYIKFVAGQVAPGLPSSMMSSEDLYQEGLLLLYTCFEKYRLKSEQEFQSIFKASCWRLLKGFCYKKKEIQTVDLDEVFDMGYNDNVIADIYEEYRLQQVADLLAGNQNALNILKEILTPSDRTLWELQMDDARRETLKSQGQRVISSSELTIKPIVLRRALGLSATEFNIAFKETQSAVYAVYSGDVNIRSYQETDTMSDEEFEVYHNQLVASVQDLIDADRPMSDEEFAKYYNNLVLLIGNLKTA